MNKLQTVYIPTKVEDKLPEENVLCIAEEFNGIAAGKLELNGRGIVSCDTDAIGCNVNYISHWLKPTEAFVFTPEELKQLLEEYTNRIVENVKIEAEPEIGKITIKEEINIDKHDMLKCNYVFSVNKESITSQLQPFLKEIGL